MHKYYTDLKNITFPIFKLPDQQYFYQDGILFSSCGMVIDDTNMVGQTLGLRRLKSQRKDLFPLKRGLTQFKQLVKTPSYKRVYVDNKGKPFKYVKTKMVHLKYCKIKSIDRQTNKISICQHDGHYIVPRLPVQQVFWCRIIYLNRIHPWIIYDFAYSRGQDSRIKI